jgi:hypothetical protein
MFGNSLMAEQIAATQERIISIELVFTFYISNFLLMWIIKDLNGVTYMNVVVYRSKQLSGENV